MNYTIKNSDLEVSITKRGIELCSVISLKTGKEYMWRADQDVWGSHAPVLFPIIGALKNGELFYKEKSYPVPKHGLVRHSEKVERMEQTSDSILFKLKWDEESLKKYPFKFEFLTHYSLEDHTLTIHHTVKNPGDEMMYFSLGGHPAFNCPFFDGDEYEDYYLDFEEKETDSTWLLDNSGLVSTNRTLILNDTSTLPLHKDLFNNDALIFKELRSRKVSLVSKNHGKVLSVNFDGFPYLGIWAKPASPFVCIEPWLGITDASDSTQKIEEKEGMLILDPGAEFEAEYSITFY
ncbi:MAG TPA: aldose epimerase [Balneolaceae bacterium]|nr:aldose epimerase [Balneolaceae bacterium]|tara:strand:- start:3295 stop:4170 length:876 start_codon:yes stop_codon:yes gene_type:complete